MPHLLGIIGVVLPQPPVRRVLPAETLERHGVAGDVERLEVGDLLVGEARVGRPARKAAWKPLVEVELYLFLCEEVVTVYQVMLVHSDKPLDLFGFNQAPPPAATIYFRLPCYDRAGVRPKTP